MSSKIVTLHDISGDEILVNLDKINLVRNAETCTVVYLSDNQAVKVSETFIDIKKFISSKHYIGWGNI